MDGQAQGKELRPHQRRLQGAENLRWQAADGMPQVRHKPQVRGVPRVRVPAIETVVSQSGGFTGELAMPFQDAYERILQSTGLRTQTDVAALLGVKQSSISDAKRRNHIPDSWIFSIRKASIPLGSAPEKARSMWRERIRPRRLFCRNSRRQRALSRYSGRPCSAWFPSLPTSSGKR